MNNMSKYPNVIMGIRCYKAGAIYRVLGSIFPHLPIIPHKGAVISILHHICVQYLDSYRIC